MSWITKVFTSSVGRKFSIALTGLFLCLFLVVHLAGNLQLLLPNSRDAFNSYSHFMTHFELIKIVSYVTYLSILYHAISAVTINLQNRAARPVGYTKNRASQNSSLASRSMVFLGVVIFVYIVVHLQNFWFKMKFGDAPTYMLNGKEVHDLYNMVLPAFQQWWLVALYVISMIVLGFHLSHGFKSAFQTLGLHNSKYVPLVQNLSVWLFGIIIPFLFALIPVYLYFAQLANAI